LVRNAKPSAAPARDSQTALAFSSARVVQYAPATMSSTSSASGLSKRNISTATGVRASARPPIRPATGPKRRLSVA
jgi:hypothetical protein